jgi:peptidoglycan/LPS O-acetylase OafA/YrhL
VTLPELSQPTPQYVGPHPPTPTRGRSTGAGGHLRFRPDIEGLRAVAIVMVVLYHGGVPRTGGGFLGVDVFFVLSGFLITGIIVDEVAATGTVSLLNFWARRARRLLPAATFVTLCVLAANALLLSPFEQIARAETAKAFAVFGSNILFAIRSTDYFGGIATRDPLLHTWSLSVEEQYYLFFAPTLLLLAVLTRKVGHASFRRILTIATVVLSIASLIGCVFLVRRYPVIAFYILPPRAWEFGLGALAVLVVGKRGLARGARSTAPATPEPEDRILESRAPVYLEVIAVASILGLLFSMVYLNEGRAPALGLATLIPTLSTVGLLLSGATEHPTFVARGLALPPMRLIGRLSYSWYLWHWPALVYLRDVVRSPTLTMTMAVAVLSLIPAAATYLWIESPIRFSKPLQRRPRYAVGGAIVFATLTYLAAPLAVRHADATLASPRYAAVMAARSKARVYADGCQVPLLGTVSPPCVYGPGRNDTTLVLFGDSHAAHWFPAFDSVATLRGWKLVNLTKTGCPSVTVPLNNMGRRYVECDQWRRYAINRIVQMHPTMVVVSNDRTYNVIVGDSLPLTDSSGSAREAWHDGLVQTLNELSPSNARVLVLEDTPQPGVDVPRCLVKYIDEPKECDATTRRALHPGMSDAERRAVSAVRGVTFFSMNAYLCDAGTCPVSRDGVVRFADDDHLAVHFSAMLAPLLSQELTRAVNDSTPPR